MHLFARRNTKWSSSPPQTGIMLGVWNFFWKKKTFFIGIEFIPEDNRTDLVVSIYFPSDHKTVLTDYLVYNFESMAGEVGNIMFCLARFTAIHFGRDFPQVGGLLGMFLGISLLNFFDAGGAAFDFLKDKMKKANAPSKSAEKSLMYHT